MEQLGTEQSFAKDDMYPAGFYVGGSVDVQVRNRWSFGLMTRAGYSLVPTVFSDDFLVYQGESYQENQEYLVPGAEFEGSPLHMEDFLANRDRQEVEQKEVRAEIKGRDYQEIQLEIGVTMAYEVFDKMTLMAEVGVAPTWRAMDIQERVLENGQVLASYKEDYSKVRFSPIVGAGIRYPFSENIFMTAGYRYIYSDDIRFDLNGGDGSIKLKPAEHHIELSIGRRF